MKTKKIVDYLQIVKGEDIYWHTACFSIPFKVSNICISTHKIVLKLLQNAIPLQSQPDRADNDTY